MEFIVAVDGPAGSGKGTVTKIVGKREKLLYIDTGAMYRCVTLDMLRKNIGLEDIEKIKEILKHINIEFKEENGQNTVYLNGENVTSANDAIKNTNSTITGPEGDKDVIKNVYDLYGGRLEWTLEANNTSTRVLKGRLLQPQQFTELP